MEQAEEEKAEVPPHEEERQSEEPEEKSIEQQINEVYQNDEFATPFEMPTNLPEKEPSERDKSDHGSLRIRE